MDHPQYNMNKIIYRWVEPEKATFDENGKKIFIPEHQEEGEYIEEASIRGYVVVALNGNKHLVADRDIIAILSNGFSLLR